MKRRADRSNGGGAPGWPRLLLVGWLALPAAAAGADGATASTLERAGQLLERMAAALVALDYEGTLVYLHDERLETLHLTHRIDNGQVQERLLSLSGPVRAVSRESDRVICALPEGHPISVRRQRGGSYFPRGRNLDPVALEAHYRIELPGYARVAGRETEILGIVPRDELRYGYRFHLDRETGLPLKSDLIDSSGTALEQLMFATIQYRAAADAPPPPQLRGDDPPPEDPPPPRAASAEDSPGRWRFEARPAGFELAMHDRIEHPDGADIEHFLFSDRLSAYSVYIERDLTAGLDGETRIGAIHAAGRRVEGYQITAVGEVPAATVAAAIAGARPSTTTGERKRP